ncbi:MAG: RraA family protein [Pseudomonadota bacterium]
MIEEPKKLTIKRPTRRPTAKQIAAFQGVPTSFVVDAMFGGGSLTTAIAPLPGQTAHVAGPALTVYNRPSDILALLGALAFITEGDVVLSSAAGFQGCAAAGDRVCGMIKNNGGAGFVTDGPMRDLSGLNEVGLPAWCTGLNPDSPYSTGPGKIGLPIQIGGQRVETGDMVIADENGVVIVPFDQIDTVVLRLQSVTEAETALDAEVADGLKIPPAIAELLDGPDVDWVD